MASTVNDYQARTVLRHLLRSTCNTMALTGDESELAEGLAQKLGVPIVWEWYDLTEGEWHEGRYPQPVTEQVTEV